MISISSKNSGKSMKAGATGYGHDALSKVGALDGKGWCVDSKDDVGGRLALNDPCKGMINCEFPRAASRGNSFIDNVFLESSLI